MKDKVYNSTDINTDTTISSLYLAVKYNRLNIVEYLVKNDKTNVQYQQLNNALDLATHLKNEEIAQYLKREKGEEDARLGLGASSTIDFSDNNLKQLIQSSCFVDSIKNTVGFNYEIQQDVNLFKALSGYSCPNS